MMDAIFETAVKSTGEAYLQAEARLRAGGHEAQDTLHRNLQHPDPIARLVARVILDFMGQDAKDYQAALDYLERLPALIRETPLPVPRSDGAAQYLSEEFGDKLVELGAVRLVKGTHLPRWYVGTLVIYAQLRPSPLATEALLRFAVTTKDEVLRELAVDAIRAAADPALSAKVAAERARCQSLGLPFPAELDALTGKVP
jgi:hypothetical protein